MSEDKSPEGKGPPVEGDEVDSKTSVHVAIQAYDYEIERGASVLPARRRIIPIKFRDFQDPDEIDDDNNDKDFVPNSVGPTPIRISRTGNKRGRPRKIPRDHAYANGKEEGQAFTGVIGASNTKPPGSKADIPPSIDTDMGMGNESQEGTTTEESRNGQSKPNTIDPDSLIRTRPYKCDCGLSFQRLASLKKHKWLAHKDEKEESHEKTDVKAEKADMPRPFKCSQCDKRFGQKGNLKVHMRTHTGEKPFKCDMEKCSKSFRSNESLRRHKLAHLGIKLYECDICKNKFASNVALKEHISRHTDSRPYECDICNKKFRQVSCFKRHLVTHSSELPYKCEICGKGFSQTIYMKSHMRSHTGERPYTCEICGKSFAHASDKTRHKTVHTGEKKYACNVCGSHFSDPSTCRRHVREHTGHKPYPCQLCGDAFKRSGQLKAHLNKKHVHLKESILLDKGNNKVASLQFADGKWTTIHAFQELANSQPTIIINNDMFGEHQEVITQIVQEQLQSKTGEKQTEQVHTVQQGQSLLKPAGEQQVLVSSTQSQAARQEEHVMVDTQRILEQIQSQLDPSQAQLINQDGLPVEVAYQIIHDDENQQIVEIQYQPVSAPVEVSEQGGPQEQDISVVDNNDMISGESATELVHSEPSQVVDQAESVSGLTLNNSLNCSSTEDREITSEVVQNEEVPMEHSALDSQEVSEDIVNDDSVNSTPLKTLSSQITLEYVANPDFNSQEYYNWLSSFTEDCKQVVVPLDVELFQRISQVHKTLSDILANPRGVLSNKDNFKILMSISKDLNEIISQHLNHVLQNLDEKTD